MRKHRPLWLPSVVLRHAHSRRHPGQSSLVGILAVCLLLLTGPAHGNSQLNAYEEQLFSVTYSTDSLQKRLSRLEEHIFGEAQTGDDAQRMERLQRALGIAQRVAPHSARQAQSNTPNVPTTQQPAAPSPTRAATAPIQDATDYPTVVALERAIFSRDFIHDDIGNRLSRLEKKVFGQPSPHMPLVDRVDRLLSHYPQANQIAGIASPKTVENSSIRDLPSHSSQLAGSSRDVYTKVDALEARLLNGRVYPNDLLTERLDRLEQRLFGRTNAGSGIDTRLERLMQHFNTNNGSGIAGFGGSGGSSNSRPPVQERPAYQPSPSGYYDNPYGPPPPARPNVQIGAGMSSHSSYQFSPDMMRMLPPQVRQQMMGGQHQGGTVVSAPGTVVFEQRNSTQGSTPGFQTYGPGGLPQQHYYRQNQTTIVQPQGGAISVQQHPVQTGIPAHTGNPKLLQALTQLESNIFGQVNTMEPVYTRLSKLELSLFGQVFPNRSETQRIQSLQQAHRYQSIGRLFGPGSSGATPTAPNAPAPLGVPLGNPAPGTR